MTATEHQEAAFAVLNALDAVRGKQFRSKDPKAEMVQCFEDQANRRFCGITDHIYLGVMAGRLVPFSRSSDGSSILRLVLQRLKVKEA